MKISHAQLEIYIFKAMLLNPQL